MKAKLLWHRTVKEGNKRWLYSQTILKIAPVRQETVIGNPRCIALKTYYFWETRTCLLSTSVLFEWVVLECAWRRPRALKTNLKYIIHWYLFLLLLKTQQTTEFFVPRWEQQSQTTCCLWFHQRIILRPSFEGEQLSSVSSREEHMEKCMLCKDYSKGLPEESAGTWFFILP